MNVVPQTSHTRGFAHIYVKIKVQAIYLEPIWSYLTPLLWNETFWFFDMFFL